MLKSCCLPQVFFRLTLCLFGHFGFRNHRASIGAEHMIFSSAPSGHTEVSVVDHLHNISVIPNAAHAADPLGAPLLPRYDMRLSDDLESMSPMPLAVVDAPPTTGTGSGSAVGITASAPEAVYRPKSVVVRPLAGGLQLSSDIESMSPSFQHGNRI